MFIGDDFIPDYECYSEEEEEEAYFEALIEEKKQQEQDFSWLYEDDDPYANEIWKPIPGYEGMYEVSDMGRVKSLKRFKQNHSVLQEIEEKILIPNINNKTGYAQIILSNNSKKKNKLVHQLVAEVFIPNPENKPFVDHFDTNRSNNNVNNLEWATFEENANNDLSRYHNSLAKKGVFVGRKMSEEAKEKMRQSHLGKEVSNETREKIRKIHQGKKVSPEAIQKRIETMRKNNISFSTNTGKHRYYNEETGKYYYK